VNIAIASGKGGTGKTTVAEAVESFRMGDLSEAAGLDVEGHLL